MIKLEGGVLNFSINGVPQQRGSCALITSGNEYIGLRFIGSDRQLVAPEHFSGWEDGTGTPYPTLAALITDLADLVFESNLAGLQDAPSDGTKYARINGAWTPLIFDGFVETWQFDAMIDANNINISRDFERDQGLPLNLLPYIMPQAGRLKTISINSENAATFDVQILVGGAVAKTVSIVGATEVVVPVVPDLNIASGAQVRARFIHTGTNARNAGVQLNFTTKNS